MSIPVAIPGMGNVRDLGGVGTPAGPVRAGMLFRGDAPVALEPNGIDALRGLEIRVAIDLRERVERRRDPSSAALAGARVVEMPLFSGLVDLETPRELDVLYVETLNRCGERIAAVAGAVAAAGGGGALVHCSAGKDRTGLAIAVILAALGVTDEAIVADYTATETQMEPAALAAVRRRAVASGIPEQQVAQQLGAPAWVMERALRHLGEQHGGGRSYLLANGLRPGDLEELRRALICPPGAKPA